MLGGVATISGAIPGAILFVFVPYYTAQWSSKFSFLEGRIVAPADALYGVLLLAVVFVLPGGVMDGIRRLRIRIVRIVPNPSWLSSVKRVEQTVATGSEGVPHENNNEASARPNPRY